MKTRLIAPAAASALLLGSVALAAPAVAATGPGAAPAAVAPAATSGLAGVTAPINQTIAGLGTFVGSFTPTSFTSQNGQLAANGTVTGTLTTLAGQTVNVVNQAVSAPVTNAATGGGCQILDLQLGPLHLNLLGLVVDLNQVNLNITAAQGPGNLLGNLLCSVANLLNGGNTGGLATLLNQVLGL